MWGDVGWELGWWVCVDLGVRERGQDDGGDNVGEEWMLHRARVPTHLGKKVDQGEGEGWGCIRGLVVV